MGPWIVGIDVGARTIRAVLMDGNRRFTGRAARPSGAFFTRTAEQVFDDLLAQAGIARDAVSYVMSTGYGRSLIDFRDLQVTEMTSHGVGALHLFPKTRTVLDMGAQNTRVVVVAKEGRVERFKMNDKCAAGAGRFLERVALSLEVPLEDLGRLALQADSPQTISSVCAVLAESEVINLVSLDKRVDDILLGAHHSICDRVLTLVRQAGMEPEVTLTGGLVHNPAMVKVLEERFEMKVNVSPDGEYAGAIGAALLGRRRYDKRHSGGDGDTERGLTARRERR